MAALKKGRKAAKEEPKAKEQKAAKEEPKAPETAEGGSAE
jgi:hypothetical protein